MSLLRRLLAAELEQTVAVEDSLDIGGVLDFDPSTSTLVNTVAQDSTKTLNRMYRTRDGSKTFRYVQFKDAVAYAQGQPVFVDASLGGRVTNDVSEAASATLPEVAGICLGVQTADYFGYVQTRGVGTVLHNNDDDAAIGSQVHATVADTGVANVTATYISPALMIGYGLVAVVAGTNLQSVDIATFGTI